MKKEEWKSIKGYESQYEISSFGNVKSLPKKRGKKTYDYFIRKNCIGRGGYYRISLCSDYKIKSITIHRLVAIHFIDNKKNKPCINHKDGNKLNNAVENLEWCTYKENYKHAVKFGLTKKIGSGENQPRHKLSINNVEEIRKSKLKVKQLSLKFNVSIYCIYDILSNKNWKNNNENKSNSKT